VTTAVRPLHRHATAAAALAALGERFGDRLSVAPAVREQHGNTTTWIANEPPDAVVFPRTGQGKVKYLRREHGQAALSLMRTIKMALDPYNIMNPGEIIMLGNTGLPAI